MIFSLRAHRNARDFTTPPRFTGEREISFPAGIRGDRRLPSYFNSTGTYFDRFPAYELATAVPLFILAQLLADPTQVLRLPRLMPLRRVAGELFDIPRFIGGAPDGWRTVNFANSSRQRSLRLARVLCRAFLLFGLLPASEIDMFKLSHRDCKNAAIQIRSDSISLAISQRTIRYLFNQLSTVKGTGKQCCFCRLFIDLSV